MAILPIITAPDPRLKEVSSTVSEITPEIKLLIKDMLDTLYADHGVGIAAIQVGVSKRIVVLDLRHDDEEERPEGFYPLYLINPNIVRKSDKTCSANEGCLSVPTLQVKVTRPETIKVTYLNLDGIPSELETGGWLARAIQHEMDHLAGILTIDYLSSIKKDLAITKLKKFKKHML